MNTYYGVQSLRALGALLVVVFHATNMVRDKISPDAWQFTVGMSGVDLFFTISGFIMVVATRHLWGKPATAWPFLKRRLIRIVPLYWLATSMRFALVLLVLLVPSLLTNGSLEWWHTVASYLFIPAWNANHEPFPLLVAGWTLSFELLFYFLFALALRAKLQPVFWLSGLFVVLAAISAGFAPFSQAVLALVDPRLLEFSLGMAVGMAATSQRLLPKRPAFMLVIGGIALLLANPLAGTSLAGSHLLTWGVPSALLLYGVVSLEAYPFFWRARWIQALGNASYAIYLFHAFVVSAVGILIKKLPLDVTQALIFSIALTLPFAAVSGVMIYHWFEKPSLAWLRKKLNA